MLLVPRILRSFAAIVIIRGTLAFDSLDRLLEDAIPILFPPVRMSLHLCRLGQGKKREDANQQNDLIQNDFTRVKLLHF